MLDLLIDINEGVKHSIYNHSVVVKRHCLCHDRSDDAEVVFIQVLCAHTFFKKCININIQLVVSNVVYQNWFTLSIRYAGWKTDGSCKLCDTTNV